MLSQCHSNCSSGIGCGNFCSWLPPLWWGWPSLSRGCWILFLPSCGCHRIFEWSSWGMGPPHTKTKTTAPARGWSMCSLAHAVTSTEWWCAIVPVFNFLVGWCGGAIILYTVVLAHDRHMTITWQFNVDHMTACDYCLMVTWPSHDQNVNSNTQHGFLCQGGVVRLHCSASSPLVYSGSLDGVVRVWDVRSGECVQQWYGHSDHILDITVAR